MSEVLEIEDIVEFLKDRWQTVLTGLVMIGAVIWFILQMQQSIVSSNEEASDRLLEARGILRQSYFQGTNPSEEQKKSLDALLGSITTTFDKTTYGPLSAMYEAVTAFQDKKFAEAKAILESKLEVTEGTFSESTFLKTPTTDVTKELSYFLYVRVVMAEDSKKGIELAQKLLARGAFTSTAAATLLLDSRPFSEVKPFIAELLLNHPEFRETIEAECTQRGYTL
jgi:hypothetical protein